MLFEQSRISRFRIQLATLEGVATALGEIKLEATRQCELSEHVINTDGRFEQVERADEACGTSDGSAEIAGVAQLSPRIQLRLPEWVRRSVLNTEDNRRVRSILKEQNLNTICESGRCPNKGECWAKGTATYMLMGSLCTRTCKFCAVNKGLPDALDEDEPQRVANASKEMGLRHVVLTSVNRDDLPDQGANHFAKTIRALKETIPGINVEVLTPDFQGREDCIAIVLEAGPTIYNHNIETVPRLYRQVRPGSKYKRSLEVLAAVKRLSKTVPTKSGLMLGLGETKEEVAEVLKDLREIDCDFLTLGQYLRPSLEQLPVERYLTPEEFEEWSVFANDLKFKLVHSGPLVRSSYHAEELAGLV